MNPTILNDYVEYLSTIKGRSNGTITEYTYDISNFLKFITASKNSITVKILVIRTTTLYFCTSSDFEKGLKTHNSHSPTL